MKNKVAILGSTGSIGKTCLKIIAKDKKNFDLQLLTAQKNYKLLLKQAKIFSVKHIIITDKKSYQAAISKNIKNIKIYNNFNQFNKIFPKKLDYVMSAIVGLDGLIPTINIIKYTKVIAIANKETIICAWNLIKKKLDHYKTKFIPVDSEHFSIWYALKNYNNLDIDKIYLTASGGSLLNIPKSQFKKIKISKILKHPNWKMGKKITIDSATLMNKVFEVIEAKNIFNLSYKKISILTHPKSYIHTIIKFENGINKILAHDPDMKIPIYNSLYIGEIKKYKTKTLNIDILNNLNLKKVDLSKFSLVKILDILPKHSSLFETVLISVNDYLVHKFLKKKISFKKLIYLIDKITKSKEFQKYKKIKPKKLEDIYRLKAYVSSKIDSLGI